MVWAYDGDLKEEVRSRIPIEDLIRDYSITLTPSGGNRLRALCPFHHEKTPSFYVNTEKQFYHCFGCKESGDIFTFVKKMDHVEFPEALEILARRAGVELRPSASPDGGKKVRLFDVLTLARDYYHRILMEDPRGDPGRKYLERRRISVEMWKKFHLGYSLPEWDGLVRFAAAKFNEGRRVTPDLLEAAGLARRREGASGYYDYFRGRVMFAIADAQKRTIGFGARTLGDDQPKYLNTPKTVLFDKGHVLYGLPQARAAIAQGGRIAIMEGYTDAIMAHQKGIEFAVASLGTAFTVENARRLHGLAPRVDLVFDGDAAGQSASERSLELLVAEDLDVRIFTVTTGKDPCDALLELGGEEFRRRLDAEARGIFEFKWKMTVAGAEARGEGPAGIARAFDEVLSLLAKVPNVIARKLHARTLAERLGLDEDDLNARLKRYLSPLGPVSSPLNPPGGTVEGTSSLPKARTGESSPSLEEVILECMIAEPDRARERRGEVPEGLWPFGDGIPGRDPALASVAMEIDRQIDAGGALGGAIDIGSLRAVVDEAGLEVLFRILARLEKEGDAPLRRDDVWKSCLRELDRKAYERRKKFLEAELSLARKARDGDRYDADRCRALERELLSVQLRLKGGSSGGTGGRQAAVQKEKDSVRNSDRSGLTMARGESQKGIPS
jgi:DNA primase